MPAQTVIRLRRGTAAQWASANPILAGGEVGLETDTYKTKYGDGVTAWNSLPYSVATSSGGTAVDWTDVLNKPATFPPSTHTHVISDVTGLQDALDGKADEVHVHVIGDVTGLQDALDGKAASTHTHAISDVTNLQTSLDGKAASTHTHGMGDLTDFSISSPAVDQILKYNGTDWVNDPANKLGASAGDLGIGVTGTYSLTVGKSRNTGGVSQIVIQSAPDWAANNTASIFKQSGALGQLSVYNNGNVAITATDSTTGASSQITATTTGSITGNFGSLVSNNSNTSIALLSNRSVRGGILRCTASSAVTITIPTQAESTAASAQPWVIGDRIDILQAGTGQITFSPNAGVTLVSVDSKRKTNKQYSGATLICVATNTFHLIGDLAA